MQDEEWLPTLLPRSEYLTPMCVFRLPKTDDLRSRLTDNLSRYFLVPKGFCN
jgi:hypothetical protein